MEASTLLAEKEVSLERQLFQARLVRTLEKIGAGGVHT